MPEDQTLFAHLALKLAHHPENIAVEALGHILSTSPAAVRALEDVLQTGGAEVGEIAQVQTQASDAEGSRPDLAGRDADGRKRMLIEAKFWAGLTERQPVTYLKHLLKQDQPSVLLFIAPAKRVESLSLWNELCRLVKAADLELVLGQTEGANPRSAVVDGKCHLMLTSWATLLDRMVSRANTAGESHTECDIQQLLGLAEQMDKEAFLPLRPDELGPEFPRRLINLENLVADVIERLEQKELAVDKSNISQSHTTYGRYLKFSGAGAWFGLDHNKWVKVRDTPLWLYLYDESNYGQGVKPLSEIRDNLRPLGLMTPPELFEFVDNELVIPIYLPVGVEYDAVLDAVVTRLKEVAKRINPAN